MRRRRHARSNAAHCRYSYDDCNPASSNPEDNYGLAYHDGTPKPSLAVFRANAAG